MKKYGGGFVKQLAELMLHADPINLMKIRNTWSDYIAEYKRFAEKD